MIIIWVLQSLLCNLLPVFKNFLSNLSKIFIYIKRLSCLRKIKFNWIEIYLSEKNRVVTKGVKFRGFHLFKLNIEKNNPILNNKKSYSTLKNVGIENEIEKNKDEPTFSKEVLAYTKANEIKLFKQRYKGGYLGYRNVTLIYNNILRLVDVDEKPWVQETMIKDKKWERFCKNDNSLGKDDDRTSLKFSLS